MAKVRPPVDRATVTERVDGLEVSTPAKKNWFVIVFLAFWLVVWFFGAATASRELINPTSANVGAKSFLLVWLAAWFLGGGCALVLWLWTIAGVERVVFEGHEIRIRREVFGVGISREYDSAHARGLRAAPDAGSMFEPRAALRFWGIGGGPIAFDYGSSTVRFGNGLDEAEAARIVARILNRYSALARKDT